MDIAQDQNTNHIGSQSSMSETPHVALHIETSKQHGRGLVMGIGKYLETHGPWSVSLSERGQMDLNPDWIKDWDGDGIITRNSSPEMIRIAKERNIPLVHVSYFGNLDPSLNTPCVNADQAATGRLVAKHFERRGFVHYGFIHAEGQKWSEERRDAFAEALGPIALSMDLFNLEPDHQEGGKQWEADQQRLCDWVKELPTPCAIMATYDVFGARVLDACRRVGKSVPKEIAVVGCDNDPLFCAISWPPLSSAEQNVGKIGYEAARILDELMRNDLAFHRQWPLLIEPNKVITRTSSEIFAFDDPKTADALRFIRDHACRRITVDEVASFSNTSRRELERSFKRELQSSPYKEIQRARISKVSNLLLC